MRGAAVLLTGIWLLGLFALGAVIQFERRADTTRQAQVVISEMRIEQGEILRIAFSPATVAKGDAPQAQTARQLARAKLVLSGSMARLTALGNSDAPGRIATLNQRYVGFVDHLGALVASGASGEAALELGASERPGGIQATLGAELDRADASYGAKANRSRTVAVIGTVASIGFLLVAFSVAFGFSLIGRRRSHRDATTDALTGLGNRRKLFADMRGADTALARNAGVTIGIFDLDGFKGYNDTFGHPAGDALLARLGRRLTAAVGENGIAYRIGGDEFVVTTTAAQGGRLLMGAKAALSEQGTGFTIGCSVGSTRIVAGDTLDDALHVADERLYANKRSVRGLQTEVKDALLQVLAEQSASLVTHLGQVAELAENTARHLGLPPDQIKLTRLAAELHDIGKAAIPASILDKPGPLDADERSFMERHSVIGERIAAAAPTLEAIAPIIRAAHERPDGTGYPDRLHLGQIPICSRIIAVVDAFAAMTTNRPYQHAISSAEAIEELRLHAGTQFDPAVVEAFSAALVATVATPSDKLALVADA